MQEISCVIAWHGKDWSDSEVEMGASERNPEDRPDRETFRLLLPWFINGTLGAVESKHMQEVIDDQEWAKSLWQQELLMIDMMSPYLGPGHAQMNDLGLTDLLERVRAEYTERRAPPSQQPNWWTRWPKIFTPSPLSIQPALAVIFVGILMGQSILLGLLWHHESDQVSEPEAVRSMTGIPSHRTLRIVVADAVSEAEFRRILRATGAKIVAGPSQFGDYWIESSTLSAKELMHALEKSTLFLSISFDESTPEQ